MAEDKRMVAALLRERDALAQQGKSDRVKQVDEQLEHYGYKSDDEKGSPRKQAPQGRSSKPQQTGD